MAPPAHPSRLDPAEGGVQGSERWDESDRAHLVIGPRQAGKSTAIWAHLAQRGEPALFLDCEQELVREWCRSAPLFLAEWIHPIHLAERVEEILAS